MLRSLRTRLALFSLLPIVVAVGVAGTLAVQASNEDDRSRTREQLQTQARAIARIYGKQMRVALGGPGTPPVLSSELREATAADLFYEPRSPLGGPVVSLPRLRGVAVDWALLDRGETQTLDRFVPPGSEVTHLVVLRGVSLTPDGRPPVLGAVALARPVDELAPAPLSVAARLAPAFLVAAAVSMLLALYLGTGVTRPLRRLVAATGRIAAGEYAVALDRRRRDEIGSLNRAFGDMADKLREADEHERLFLMRVSHELRTPLTAIQGHIQALSDGIVDDPRDRDTSYAVIADEASRLGRLISDLLDLAKLEARRFTLQVEQVDLGALLQHGIDARRATAQRRGVALIEQVDGAPIVLGDGDRILQIVTNLLENAVRWTPAGGLVRVSASADDAIVRLEVADSGPGVPHDTRDAIFRPFYSEDGKGTGLGLAIAAELAAAMGATLEVGDAPEGGALFVCELPRTPVPPVETSPVAVGTARDASASYASRGSS
jgi:two-component system sensor histidine kinase BaeS